jgi:predicted amidohydrolase
MFDLMLKGGRAGDPAGGVDARLDVAFADGTVAEVSPDLSGGQADAQCLRPDRDGRTTRIATRHAPGLLGDATVLTLEHRRSVFEDVLGEKPNAERRLAGRGIVLGGSWWRE